MLHGTRIDARDAARRIADDDGEIAYVFCHSAPDTDDGIATDGLIVE
jgi:hypothetical protein